MSAALLALAMWMAQQQRNMAEFDRISDAMVHKWASVTYECRLPEPSIVPAVQKMLPVPPCGPDCINIGPKEYLGWTCEDGSRVLLETVGGQKLCWKPQ